MSVQRSTVVLVHGGWHGSWCWERVTPLLDRRGSPLARSIFPASMPMRTTDLACRATPRRSPRPARHAEPALLCGHSYGGMVITQAAAGREDVARLVYLCAFMPDADESLLSIIGEPPP